MNSDGTGLAAEYRYNGLGMKIAHHYDSTRSGGGLPDGAVDADDPWYFTCYNEKWQAITIFRGSDSASKERYIYHAAGLDGLGSASYIDEVVLRDWDKNSGWTAAADGTKEVRYYHLYNFRHDLVATLTPGGALVEQVKYSAYGVPYGLPAGDANHDGDYDSGDDGAVDAATGYEVQLDFDLDGDVDAADKTHAYSIKGSYHATGYGETSTSTVFNRRGYAGYEDAFELAGNKYHVRHRFYDADLGRWTRRDPLGYVDGMGLYEYVHTRPITGIDPTGLAHLECNHPPFNCPGLWVPSPWTLDPEVITPVLIPVITPILPECTVVAGVGLFCCVTIGTVVTCSVLIAEQLFPFEIPPHNPPPEPWEYDCGDPSLYVPPIMENEHPCFCNRQNLRAINQVKGNACNAPTCNSNTPGIEACFRANAWDICGDMREAELRWHDLCPGGTPSGTHPQALATARTRAQECQLICDRYLAQP